MIGTSPDVVVVKNRETNTYFSAETAAGAIITTMLDFEEGYLTVAPVVMRYTSDSTPGGNLSTRALEVYGNLPKRPRNPYPNGAPPADPESTSILSARDPGAEKRVKEWERKSRAWREDSIAMVVAGLGLR